MSVVNAQHLTFSYDKVPVINDLEITINQGEFVLVTGSNGSGKSTFIKLLLGELVPDEGSITLFDQNPSSMKNFDHIGYVPQMRIFEQVAFPITCLELVMQSLYSDFGFIKMPRKRHRKQAIAMLTELGLEKHLNTPLTELSGGLKQRAMLARAMIKHPSLLILDEPVSGVDQASKHQLAQLLNTMQQQYKLTLLLVTHELDFLLEDLNNYKIIEMKGGRFNNVRL